MEDTLPFIYISIDAGQFQPEYASQFFRDAILTEEGLKHAHFTKLWKLGFIPANGGNWLSWNRFAILIWIDVLNDLLMSRISVLLTQERALIFLKLISLIHDRWYAHDSLSCQSWIGIFVRQSVLEVVRCSVNETYGVGGWDAMRFRFFRLAAVVLGILGGVIFSP